MAHSGKNRREGFHFILAILALSVLGWIWWRSGRAAERKDVKSAKTNRIGQMPKGQPAAVSTTSPAIPRIDKMSASENRPARADMGGTPRAEPREKLESPTLERKAASCLSSSAQGILEAQIALVRHGISPGSLDGLLGSQTRAALNAWSDGKGERLGGDSNLIAELRLSLDEPSLIHYFVTTNDLARLLPMETTWLGKSQQERLDYETILELLAEKSQSHPNLLRRLNPGLDWNHVIAGAEIVLPNVSFPPPGRRAASIRILLQGRALEVWDCRTNLLARFPCSIAQRVEKRPVGELRVAVVAPNPNYTFDPEVFPESQEAQELGRKLVLQPGPNNPVGTVWIGLDKPGYGIHGTPRPEDVGRTESHGCFRLANWNAEYLLRLVGVGTPVLVEP
jgi:lipoprotein-anchoring transpeptidase ErfK/SrfK